MRTTIAYSAKGSAATDRLTGPSLWVYLVAIIPPVLLCTAIALQPYVEPAELFRDPLSVALDAAARGECCHAYYGFVSQLGNLVWVGGSFIALFAATVLFTRGNSPGAGQFMAAAGMLTGILVMDDMFQGHEFVYPTLFGIPEIFTVAIYALLVAAYLWRFRTRILAVGPGLLIISLLAFAIGVMADLFVSDTVAWHRLTEDGSKLLGICTWTAFHWWAAWTQLASR